MKRKLILLVIALLIAAAGLALAWRSFRSAIVPVDPQSLNMRLESASFASGGAIPTVYSCDGKSLSPELRISGVPSGAKSLALIMHDPDTQNDFIHWVFWNADPATTVINEGETPAGAMHGHGGSGKDTYVGPCPPTGTHQYVFELFALDEKLRIDPATPIAGLRAAMRGHILDTTTLTGTYARQH